MFKKLLFAAPLALAAGAVLTTPASAAEWGRQRTEVTQVTYANGYDSNRSRDAYRDRGDYARHEFGRRSHHRRHHERRVERYDRQDRR